MSDAAAAAAASQWDGYPGYPGPPPGLDLPPGYPGPPPGLDWPLCDYYSWDSCGFCEYSQLPQPAAAWPVPQVEWWMQKIQERAESRDGYRLRAVGNMRSTNLAPTVPKGGRNKARDQRLRLQEDRNFPHVSVPLRPPCDVGLAMTLDLLERSNVPNVDIIAVKQLVKESFDTAYRGVLSAARAYEQLDVKTQELMLKLKRDADSDSDPEAMDKLEKVKKAKMYTRDVLLWRWSGLTAWLYNQAESEFFQLYGRKMESQLMNSVAKIRQQLMQELMLRPAWKKLEAKLVDCAARDSWTPEFKGLLARFRFTYYSILGGPEKLREFRELPKVRSEEEVALEQQKALQEESLFADEVWNNAGHNVSKSVVDSLWDDDDDDDYDNFVDPEPEEAPFADEVWNNSGHNVSKSVVDSLWDSDGDDNHNFDDPDPDLNPEAFEFQFQFQ